MDALEETKTQQRRMSVRFLLPVGIGVAVVLWALFGHPPDWAKWLAAAALPAIIEGAYRFGRSEA